MRGVNLKNLGCWESSCKQKLSLEIPRLCEREILSVIIVEHATNPLYLIDCNLLTLTFLPQKLFWSKKFSKMFEKKKKIVSKKKCKFDRKIICVSSEEKWNLNKSKKIFLPFFKIGLFRSFVSPEQFSERKLNPWHALESSSEILINNSLFLFSYFWTLF